MDSHLTTDLDKVIHQKARLGIMSILMVREEADFNYLKRKLDLTDGNLSTHLRHLEDAGYLTIDKFFVGKKPKTLCKVTEKGRLAFNNYLSMLETIIRSIPQD